mmetsp:Transcript_66498/g.77165  ORF Transcript_66498/g.77165 Transcript_66498/m.77165 type:complete len:160 (+) Transcript_66498:32-511(+)
MEPSKTKDLPIAFGRITDKNTELVRALNLAVFPVVYQSSFYQSLPNYDNFTRLAFYNDILVGAISCREETKDNEKCLYILILGVLEPYRRYKVGSKLIEEVLKIVEGRKDLKYIYLHTQVGNETALKFYKKYGFEVTETLKDYYHDIQPADCHILKKNL